MPRLWRRLEAPSSGGRQGSRPSRTVVLLLHPALETSSAHDATATALLDAGYVVLRVDLPGHGQSPRFGEAKGPSWSDLTMEAMASHVLASVDEEGIDRFVVLGASLGGTLAQRIATEESDRVLAAICVASPPTPSVAFRERWRRALEREVPEIEARHWAALHGEPYWRELRMRALDYFSRIPEDAWPQEDLALYRRPFLAIEAGDDPLYSPAQTMLWRLFVKQAEVERVEWGHDFWRDGGEGQAWFLARVTRFLDGSLP